MRRFVLLRGLSEGGFILAALALAACGGGAPEQSRLAVGPQLRAPAVAQSPVVKAGFAVAETGSNVVRIYPPNNRKNDPPSCTVAAYQVIDITSDSKGDLYVPNGNGDIVEYAPGCGRRVAAWHESEGRPDDAAVFGKTVYVGVVGYPPDKPGVVSVCTSACNRILTHPSIKQLDAVAADAHGNLWASNEGELIVWRGGKMPGHGVKGYTVPFGGPAGLDFANDGTLIALDEFNATVYTLSCDAQSALCHELGSWRLRAAGFYGKLDKANAQYEVANQVTGQVDVYAYPGFAYQYSYDNGLGYQYNLVGITAFPM